MSISDIKKNLKLKCKKIAKTGVMYSLAVFVLSCLASIVISDGLIVNLLGNISVLSILFLALSAVCLFLIQIESWEKEKV